MDRTALTTAEGESGTILLRATNATGEVVVAVSGLDAAEGELSATSLVLNAGNAWTAALTVTGIADRDVDGDAAYTLSFAAPGMAAVTVAVTHPDDDISATTGGQVVGTYVSAPTTFNMTVRAQAGDDNSFFSSFREGVTANGHAIEVRWRFEDLTPGDKMLQVDARSGGELFRFEYSADDGASWRRFADAPDGASRWNGEFLAPDVGESLLVRLIDTVVAGDTTRDTFVLDLLNLSSPHAAGTDPMF